MVRKLLLACILGSALAGASACNTVKGAGQDIQSVGRAGEDAIN